MKPVWKWILGILSVIVIATLLFGIGYLGFGHRVAYMHSGFDGHAPMMRGYGYSPFGGLFMGFGMLLAALIPLGILFGVIYGAVRLAIRDSRPKQPCANCGKPVRAGWVACPHCGKKI